MMLPLGIGVTALSAGFALGLLARRRSPWWIPMRSFAIAAAVSTVVVSLLPEAMAELDVWALPALLAALALPPLLSRWGRERGRRRRSSHQWGADLAFVGFAVHQLVENLALGSYVGSLGDESPPWGIFVAVGAHTLPLTAVFVAEAIDHSGVALAWRRGGILIAATVGGYVLGQSVGELVIGAHPLLSVLVAGFLVHVVTHPHGAEDVERPRVLGWIDAVAILMGLGLPGLLGHFAFESGGTHEHGHAVQEAMLERFVQDAAFSSVPLVLGWGVTLALQRLWPARRSDPSRQPEAVLMLGWWLGGFYALAYVGVSVALTALQSRIAHAHGAEEHHEPALHGALQARVVGSVPWLLLGLVAAALASMLGPVGGVALGVVAVAFGWPTLALAPLAGILVSLGLPLAAVTMGLLVAPFLGGSSLRAASTTGWRSALLGRGMMILSAAAAAGVVGWIVGALPPLAIPGREDRMLQSAGALVALAVVFLQMTYVGLYPWIRTIVGSHPHE